MVINKKPEVKQMPYARFRDSSVKHFEEIEKKGTRFILVRREKISAAVISLKDLEKLQAYEEEKENA